MSVKYDRKEFNKVLRNIKALASPAFLKRITSGISKEAKKLTSEAFKTETDPYGTKWQPRKGEGEKRRRRRRRATGGKRLVRRKILVKTGEMKAKVLAAMGAGMTGLYKTTKYFIFHQKGTIRMPRRMIVPDPEFGLPDRWRHMIVSVSRREIFKKFGIENGDN